MKRLVLPAVLATSLSAFAAGPAWAHPVPRGGAIAGHGVGRRVVVPAYGFYGPAFGWGAYDPLWDGAVVPYDVPAGVVTGGIRLEVTPKTAQVYVDGAFAGVVDDFNGHFQHLDLAPGPHRIDISAPGFQPLTFAPYVQPDRTIDYKANMVPAAS